MDNKTLRELEWMLGGDISKIKSDEEILEQDEKESLTESLAVFISAFDNIEMSTELNESLEEFNLIDDFIKIQEAIDSIKDKLGDRLDENELMGAFMTPLIASLGVAGIGIALKSWTDGNAFVPVTVWKVLDKISRWINGDPKKANQVKTIISKSKGITPLQAARFTNIVADRQEMMKRFPRMASK